MQTPEQLKAAGNADFAAGRFAAAREHYTAAIALLDQRPSPGRELAVLYCNRAAAQLKLQHFAAALADSGAALAVQPRWAKALYRKAAALQGLGQLAPAAEAAQQALAAEPGNKDVQVLLRQLEAAAAAAAPAVAGAAAAADAAAAAGAAAAGPPADPSSPTKPDPTAALLPPLLAGAAFEYVPPADGIHENLLLLLHGLGDKPAAFGRMARQMALPQTAALALAGPQEVPFSDGGRSWHTVFDDEFNLIEGRPGEQRRVDSLLQTVAALRQLLTNLQHACGWQPHKVSLLGFSQGGTVALELARQQAAAGQPLRSCVAISAALLPEQLAGQPPKGGDRGAKQQGGTAVLITHGSRDNVVRRALVDQTADALRSAHGMSVSVHSVPGKAHSMPQGADEMRQLMQFWSQHLSRRPTAADLPGGAAAESGELLEVRPGEGGVSLELTLPKRTQRSKQAMGQYLSQPNTDQESVAGTHERLGAYGVVSMQGWRKSQEDAHIAEHLSDDCHIFGVFDGHGGPEVARFCSRRMPLELKRHPAFAAGQFEESLKQVFHRMDELMRSREGFTELEAMRRECEGGGKEQDGNEEDTYDMLRKLVQLQRMTGGQQGEGKGSMDEQTLQPEITIQAGCTAVVALIVRDQLFVANAGDSRAVLCRGGKAVPMSEDHKPAQPDERARIMAAGGFLSEIGGITRVNGNLNLSRAIGDLRYKMNNELEPKDQIITAEPDVLSQRLTRDDSFLVLACDGIWDVMDNQQVVDFVHQRLSKGIAPRDIASELLNSCLANDPREARGIGCDNMTAAIVVFEPSSGPLRHGSCSCGAPSDGAEHPLPNGHTCGSTANGASSGSSDTTMREATPVPDAAPPPAAAAAKA